jgi:Uma2 family endonuclease
MSTTVRITYDQFEAMIRRGELAGTDDRYELVFGEVCLMPVPDPPHESVLAKASGWSYRSLPEDAAEIRVQCTLGFPALDSMTLPDLAWVKPSAYFDRRPQPEDVLLIVEVSDSTLFKDRHHKAKLYAQAGISDYWIINIPNRCLEIRRDPEGGVYKTLLVVRPGEDARPLAFPDVALPVAKLFPEG